MDGKSFSLSLSLSHSPSPAFCVVLHNKEDFVGLAFDRRGVVINDDGGGFVSFLDFSRYQAFHNFLLHNRD